MAHQTNMLQSTHGQGNKVPIPRIERRHPPRKPSTGLKEDRVARACNACRKRKIKCSGGTPKCANCRANNLTCAYEQARRDRLKQATYLNHTIVALLEDLKDRVNEEDLQRINAALEDVETDLLAPPSSLSTPTVDSQPLQTLSLANEQGNGQYGEFYVAGAAGSNDGLDYVQEDLSRNQQSRATGYVGQNSEIQWLRSVQEQMENDQRGEPKGHAYNQHAHTMYEPRHTVRPALAKYISDTSFYLDSHDIEVEIAVDPYGMPDPDTAEQLFNCYFNTAYASFPLIPTSFEDEFHQFVQSMRSNRPCQTSTKWRAMLNLIFAIGAKYSHLVNAEWKGDERDHLIYMTRAIHLLGLRNTVMVIAGPDEPLVQATGLLAFYFLVIGHVSRAWIMIGLSIRLALALGLHLRNEDPLASDSKKEAMLTTWWSLHAVECLLSSITGRLPVIALEDCIVPLPQARTANENIRRGSGTMDQARTSSRSPEKFGSRSSFSSGKRGMMSNQYFSTYVSLNFITQRALLCLYSPRTATLPWEVIQQKMDELLVNVNAWAEAAFPKRTDPSFYNPSQESERAQYLFRLYYCSTRILITRPCLCRLERRASSAKTGSGKFNAQNAQVCITAALEVAQVLSRNTDSLSIYMTGPWWFIVHLIVQSMAVLLLEMVHQGALNNIDPEIQSGLKSLIEWLQNMKHQDPIAARAYDVVRMILKGCAPSLQAQVDRLFDEDPISVDSWNRHGSSSTNKKKHSEPASSNLSSDAMILDSYPDYQYTDGNMCNYTYNAQNQMTPATSFGNPFFTNFDEVTSMIDIRNTWNGVEQVSNMHVNYTGVESPGHHVPLDPNLDTWIQHQHLNRQ